MSDRKGVERERELLRLNRMRQKMIDQIIQWLERQDKKRDSKPLSVLPRFPPLCKLQTDQKSFNFGENGRVVTGGGWKYVKMHVFL
jgi:hypothetical protein